MKKLSDINWNQVYYFYEVAKKLSMKEASKIIGVSNPTISEHMKKLEDLLDVKLFKRYPRRIELTREGRNLYNYAEEMFSTGVKFLDAVSPKSIGGYPAKIGILETISTELPVEIVFEYLANFSDFGSVNTIRETVHDRLENRIVSGELDWGISLYKPKLTSLDYKLIGNSEMVFCCSNAAFKKYKDKSEILSNLPLIRSSWDEKLNKLVNDHLVMHGIVVEEFFESDHRSFFIATVQKGLCVSTFPKNEIEKSSWGKNLKHFAIGSPIYLPFYAIWPRGSRKMISIKKLNETLAARDQ